MLVFLSQSCLRKEKGSHFCIDINLQDVPDILCAYTTSPWQPPRKHGWPLIVQKNLVNLSLMFNNFIILTGMMCRQHRQLVEFSSWVNVQSHAVLTTLAPSSVQIETVERIWGVRYLFEILAVMMFYQAVQWRYTFWGMRHQHSATKSPVTACSIFAANYYDVIPCGSHQLADPMSLNQPWFNLPFSKD